MAQMEFFKPVAQCTVYDHKTNEDIGAEVNTQFTRNYCEL
jgi:hypothetical protein